MPSQTRTHIPLSVIGPLLGMAENYGRRHAEKYGAAGNPRMVPIERFEAFHGPRSAEVYDRVCGQEPAVPPPTDRFGALSTADFCRAYSCSRSTMWREAKAGRLIVRKRGDKNIVTVAEAEAWARSLPVAPIAGGAAAQ